MGRINQLIAASLIGLIKVYRYIVSGLFGHCCRFHPSCSLYGIEAIQTHGWFKGCRLTFMRLLRCQPFSKGGVDPVP